MDFITEWGKIAGMAGLALGVFLLLFREVIRKNIFSKLTKKQSYTIIIVFMLLVWTLSILSIIQYTSGTSENSSQLTVLVHGEKGKDDLVLTNRGKVRLIYGDANVVETINDKGEATFKQIPSDFFSPDASVEILFFDPEKEPYKALNPDSMYRLTKGKYISLAVKLFGLDQLRGIVKNFKTGDPIDSARVSIIGVSTFSNQFGEYTLAIPKEHQRKFQTVRCSKDGYESYEFDNVPIQTQKEMVIRLKPKTE